MLRVGAAQSPNPLPRNRDCDTNGPVCILTFNGVFELRLRILIKLLKAGEYLFKHFLFIGTGRVEL